MPGLIFIRIYGGFIIFLEPIWKHVLRAEKERNFKYGIMSCFDKHGNPKFILLLGWLNYVLLVICREGIVNFLEEKYI